MPVYLKSLGMLSGLGVGQHIHSQAKQTCVGLQGLSEDHKEWCATLGEEKRLSLRQKHMCYLKPSDDIACVGAAEVASQIVDAFRVEPRRRHVISCSSRGLQEAQERYLLQFVRDRTAAAKASPMTTSGRLSQVASSALGARGMSSYVSATCASSLQAIMQGSSLLQAKSKGGEQVTSLEVAIVASDFAVTPFVIGSLKSLGVYAKKPASIEHPYMPWAAENSGMMLGEGSMASVMTTEPEAAFAEVLGCVSRTETGISTGLSAEFVHSLLSEVVLESGVASKDIRVYLAHGSGTSKGDAIEKSVARDFFSQEHLEVKTYKSMFGHLLGSSGLANILMYEAERRNFGEKNERIALCMSLGFGGQGTAVCLRYL